VERQYYAEYYGLGKGLEAVMTQEARILSRFDLPVGVSILSVAAPR
jgi:hypothetical protein